MADSSDITSSAGQPPAGGVEDASLYLHPVTLARLGSMELRAKHIVEGVMSGSHRSPYTGFSVEFAQHRQYTPGDDIRHLDWKVFGRTDKLQLKQYQQETNFDLLLLVDASGSMRYGSRAFAEASGSGSKLSPDGRAQWSKYDHATALAAAMSYITLRQGDRVGLTVFAGEAARAVARSSSSAQWRQIVRALSADPAQDGRETDLAMGVESVLRSVSNRCILAILSDVFTDIETLEQALARVRHRGHDAIVFQILDRAEIEFDFRAPSPMVGLEGEAQLRVDPRAIRAEYLRVFNEHCSKVKKTTLKFGFDYRRVVTHDWLGPPMASYLARRNARIKKSKYG